MRATIHSTSSLAAVSLPSKSMPVGFAHFRRIVDGTFGGNMFDGTFDGDVRWTRKVRWRIQEQIQVPFIDRGGIQREGLGVGLGGPGVRVEELRR